MRRRKNPRSGSQPGQEKQKKRREPESLVDNSLEGIEQKNSRNISDEERDGELVQKTNDKVSNLDRTTLLVKEGYLLNNADPDVLDKNGVSNESNPNTKELKVINIKKHRRHQRKRKPKSSDSNSLACSPLPAVQSDSPTESLSSRGIDQGGSFISSSETLISNLIPAVHKESFDLTKDACVHSNYIHPETELFTDTSDKSSFSNHRKGKRRKKVENGLDQDNHSAISSSETTFPLSPIRGVIDDNGSISFPSKENYPSCSFKEEDFNFSFHVEANDLLDGTNVKHSDNVRAPMSEAGPGNENPISCNENASKSKPLCSQREITGCAKDSEASSLPMSYAVEQIVSLDASRRPDKKLEAMPVIHELINCGQKKLLVLDLNGVLADVIRGYRSLRKAHAKIGRNAVFIRPYCDDFLKFCFERFHIGIWSSRKKKLVHDMVDYLMGNLRHKLLFCWDQSKCTVTGFNTVQNTHKPLVLKEMKKLWNREDPDLPWEKGDYSPSNTLLVDDSPYKALCNPPYTAIFPYPYDFKDEADDFLGPGGDLRVYLEGLATTDDVQDYVQAHPFGQRAITAANPSWKFYQRIINQINSAAPNL